MSDFFTTAQLQASLRAARELAPLSSKWQHYKGGRYKVTGHAIDTDNGEVRVRYRRIGGPGFDAFQEADIEFVRPAAEWQPHRFTPIKDC